MSFSSSIFALPVNLVEINKRPSLTVSEDLALKKVSNPIKEINKNQGRRLIPSRYLCALLGFFSFVILTSQRLNLSMALVAMVNQTAQQTSVDGEVKPLECPERIIVHSNGSLKDLHKETGHFLWDSETQNYIVSASFLGMVLTQTPGGRMSELLGGKQVLVFSLVIASLCNVISPWASDWGPYALMGVQFLKGLAQGPTQPAVNRLMANWFPKPEKGFLSSLTLSGGPAGAVLGSLLIGVLNNSEFLGGWPMVFYVFGLLGLLLSFLVFQFTFNSPEDDLRITESEYKYIVSNLDSLDVQKKNEFPWKPIATTVGTWALLVGMFGQYWITYFFLSAQPIYLGTVLNFSYMESAYLNSFPYIGQILVTWLSSFASDLLVNKGYASIDVMRKVCNTLSCIGFSFGLLGVAYAECDKTLNIVYLVIAMTCVGFGYPGSLIVSLDMTTVFAGTLFGITSTLASTSGFILPLVLGSLTSKEQTLAQWRNILYISSGISLFSGVVFALFGSAKLQRWDNPKPERNLRGKDNEAFDENI